MTSGQRSSDGGVGAGVLVSVPVSRPQSLRKWSPLLCGPEAHPALRACSAQGHPSRGLRASLLLPHSPASLHGNSLQGWQRCLLPPDRSRAWPLLAVRTESVWGLQHCRESQVAPSTAGQSRPSSIPSTLLELFSDQGLSTLQAFCKQGTPSWRCCPLPALGVLYDGEGRPRQDGGEGLLLHADISEWAGEPQAVCLESLLGGCGSALRNGVMLLGGAEPGVLGAGFYAELCHALCLVPVSEPQSSHL